MLRLRMIRKNPTTSAIIEIRVNITGCPTFISGLCFSSYCEWWKYLILVGIFQNPKRYLYKNPLHPSAATDVCPDAKECEWNFLAEEDVVDISGTMEWNIEE
jgi:hypothetical protein